MEGVLPNVVEPFVNERARFCKVDWAVNYEIAKAKFVTILCSYQAA